MSTVFSCLSDKYNSRYGSVSRALERRFVDWSLMLCCQFVLLSRKQTGVKDIGLSTLSVVKCRTSSSSCAPRCHEASKNVETVSSFVRREFWHPPIKNEGIWTGTQISNSPLTARATDVRNSSAPTDNRDIRHILHSSFCSIFNFDNLF